MSVAASQTERISSALSVRVRSRFISLVFRPTFLSRRLAAGESHLPAPQAEDGRPDHTGDRDTANRYRACQGQRGLFSSGVVVPRLEFYFVQKTGIHHDVPSFGQFLAPLLELGTGAYGIACLPKCGKVGKLKGKKPLPDVRTNHDCKRARVGRSGLFPQLASNLSPLAADLLVRDLPPKR